VVRIRDRWAPLLVVRAANARGTLSDDGKYRCDSKN
jgi:hypothetical protein